LFRVLALFQDSFEEVSFGYDSYDSVVVGYDEATDFILVQKLYGFVDCGVFLQRYHVSDHEFLYVHV
jgi:hypothetical protein